jgi:glycine dehydrogenase subunit 1
MLAACGLSSLEDLYKHVPENALIREPLDIPPGMSEYEITAYFRERAEKMAHGYASFLGAGVYAHFRPVLCDVIVQRGEFLTSYTPYQAEYAQGTLQAIFEFQTMICQLTGMDVANASMYDGSTAVAEAAMMAYPNTGRCWTRRRTTRGCRWPHSRMTRRPAKRTWRRWSVPWTTRRHA